MIISKEKNNNDQKDKKSTCFKSLDFGRDLSKLLNSQVKK